MPPTPTAQDLAYLIQEGCTDEAHARRCFDYLHAGRPGRVNLYPDEKLAAIAATADPAPIPTPRSLATEARTRYYGDPVFHARVHMAVEALQSTDRDALLYARVGVLRQTAALALVVAERVDLSPEALDRARTEAERQAVTTMPPFDEAAARAAFPEVTDWQDAVSRAKAADVAYLAAEGSTDTDGISRDDAAGEWVRATYRVDAHIDGRVRFDGRTGTIVGFADQYLVLRLDDDALGHEVRVHPTWHMEYAPAAEDQP